MMTTTKTKKDELIALATELEERTEITEHNSGTFGSAECCRCTGTGDPRAGEYEIHERVGGGRRVVGCDPKQAPGYRRVSKDAIDRLREARKELAALWLQISRIY